MPKLVCWKAIWQQQWLSLMIPLCLYGDVLCAVDSDCSASLLLAASQTTPPPSGPIGGRSEEMIDLLPGSTAHEGDCCRNGNVDNTGTRAETTPYPECSTVSPQTICFHAFMSKNRENYFTTPPECFSRKHINLSCSILIYPNMSPFSQRYYGETRNREISWMEGWCQWWWRGGAELVRRRWAGGRVGKQAAWLFSVPLMLYL